MIKSLKNRLEILNFLKWIVEVPVVETTHAEIIGRYLTGYYEALVGVDDKDIPVGLMIYYINEKTHTLFILLLHARGQAMNFLDEFISFCKTSGIKKVQGYSVHGLDVFKHIPNVKKLYSVYEKEI